MHDIRFLFVQQQFIALPSMNPNGESALNHGNLGHSQWEKLISIVSGHHPKRVIEWQLDGHVCTYLSNNIKHTIYLHVCVSGIQKKMCCYSKLVIFSYPKNETSKLLKNHITTNLKPLSNHWPTSRGKGGKSFQEACQAKWLRWGGTGADDQSL